MSEQQNTAKAIVIKKYANRRLYNTQTSVYVTLDDLAEMVKRGDDFTVQDAKTGEDITRSVLTQIIFELESQGQNLLPVPFLRQLIQFYGDSMQMLVPNFLDMSLQSFAGQRHNFTEQMGKAFGMPINAFEQQIKQNMKLFEQTFGMFNPFVPKTGETAKPEDDMDSLRQQMSQMQEQLNRLSKEP